MRISTDKYKPVASNHIYGFIHDDRSMVLHIQFYNGAVYQYQGVPKGLVNGMKLAPSHGCYFWDNIRQKFPTILVGKKPLGFLNTLGNINYELFPDLHKLDKVDEQESKVRKTYEDDKMDCEEFHRLMDILDQRREKIIKKLEKDGYKFDNEEEKLNPDMAIKGDDFTFSELFTGIGEGISAVISVIKVITTGIAQVLIVFISLGAILGKAGR